VYRGGVNIRVLDKSQGLLSEIYFPTGKIRADASFGLGESKKKGAQADSNPLTSAQHLETNEWSRSCDSESPIQLVSPWERKFWPFVRE
jgi:hypothetical protein